MDAVYFHILILAITALISAFSCRLLLWDRLRQRFLDHPNQRSLHSDPVPRSGGIAINASFALAAFMLGISGVNLPPVPFWLAWIAIVGVSLCDDLRPVPVAVRLFVQFLSVGVLFVWLGPAIFEHWLPAVLAGLVLVWFTNLFNFMDGMDGLAGLMAVSGAAVLGVAGILSGNVAYALLLFAIVAAVAGFLVFNSPPARLFMGDAGSVALGFLLGSLSLAGIADGVFDWYVPLLVFLPFIFDASWTLVSRLTRGHRPWEAHRQHFYQRLVIAGWPVRRVLVLEFAIMLVFQGLALWFMMR